MKWYLLSYNFSSLCTRTKDIQLSMKKMIAIKRNNFDNNYIYNYEIVACVTRLE